MMAPLTMSAHSSLFSTRPLARLPRRAANCRHHAPAVACSATPEKEKAKVEVPDAPPAPSSPPQPASTRPATQSQDGPSVEDIQQRAAQLRAAKEQQQQLQQPEKDGFWQGVLEEVFLIKWPSPRQAIVNTILVIVIVGGTSALLFAVNTVLAELSRVIYG